MTAAYFEDHPTDPEKVILRKPPLDQGADYERGFIDGMQKQMQSSVDKAVNRMAQTQEPKIGCVNHDCDKCKAQRTWVGLTDEEVYEIYASVQEEVNKHWENGGTTMMFPPTLYKAIEAKLKEKNT